MNDYITDEVRKSALAILKDCDNDLNTYYEYMKKKEIESKKNGWKISALQMDTSSIVYNQP